MDTTHLTSLLRSLATTPSRRGVVRTLTGSALAGALSPLLGFTAADAKKKHKKKCKKCPKVDRCPHRHCCECDDNSCHLIEANGTALSACTTFCQSLGLGLTTAFETAAGTAANLCSVGQQCVVVGCPVV